MTENVFISKAAEPAAQLPISIMNIRMRREVGAITDEDGNKQDDWTIGTRTNVYTDTTRETVKESDVKSSVRMSEVIAATGEEIVQVAGLPDLPRAAVAAYMSQFIADATRDKLEGVI